MLTASPVEEAVPKHVSVSATPGAWRRARLLAAVVSPPAGAVLVLLSFHHAAGQPEPDQLQFALFWVGFLGGMLPLIAVACASRIDGVLRTSALAGIGLFGMVPTLLRGPSGPLSADEFAHLRQAIETSLRGDVGHVSYLLPITKEFPGLHQAVSAFARLTGLPLWHAGMLVIVLAHVLSVLAVYQLVRALGVIAPGAAAGAVFYTLNPSWAYFDTAVSYESLALPILLWCLAVAIGACRCVSRPGPRYITAIALCAATLPIVHHLTTIILCLIIGVLIAVELLNRTGLKRFGAQKERIWPLALTASCLAASIAFWWSNKYEWLVTYLSPALTRGGAQLTDLTGLGDQPDAAPTGERALFSGAENPLYELAAGFLFPVLALLVYLIAIAVLWRLRPTLGSLPWAFAGIGAMYFASLPMVLTKGGAEGAHRSWAFSFIGLAVAAGIAVGYVGTQQFYRPSLNRPAARMAAAGIVLVVMSIGAASVGSNVSTRFPGRPNVGDDMRSVSQEGGAVTAWMEARTAVDTPVMADRYVSQQLGSVGRMATLSPSVTFPIWDLYMSAQPVDPAVLQQVLDAEIRYFVVDARMSTTRPRLGFWFTVDEPGVDGTEPYPQSALDRFNCLPWLHAVYAAGPLTVYQVDAEILRATYTTGMAGSCRRDAP
jgi:hypothetical protein